MKLYTHSRLYCFGLKMLLYIQAAVGDSRQLGCLVQGGKSRCFTFHDEKQFRPDTNKQCNSSGSHLAMVDSDEVSLIMNKTSDQRGWFRLRYKGYGNWTYINNRTDSPSLKTMKEASGVYHRCVAFDTQSGFMSRACSEQNAFLCQVQDNLGCSSMPDGSCFAFDNTSLSWYKARYKCAMDHGGDLITSTNNITAYLNNTLNYTGGKVWIGAANGAWVWRDGAMDPVLGEAVYSNWASGHPNGSNDCAAVNLMDGTWESIECDGGGLYYICELVMPSNITTEAVVPTSNPVTVSTKAFVETSMPSKDSTNAADQTPTTLTRDLTDTILSNSTLVSTTSPLDDEENDGELRIIIISAACGGGGLLVIIVVIVAAVTMRGRKSKPQISNAEDYLTPRNSAAHELGSQHMEGTNNAEYQNIALMPTYEDVPEFTEHKCEVLGASSSPYEDVLEHTEHKYEGLGATSNPYENELELTEHKYEVLGGVGSSSVDNHIDTNQDDDTGMTE